MFMHVNRYALDGRVSMKYNDKIPHRIEVYHISLAVMIHSSIQCTQCHNLCSLCSH